MLILRSAAVFSLSFLVIASLAQASALPSGCSSESVRKLTRPINSQEPEGPTFEYRFGYIERENPEAPLLVFLPGGPGTPSISAGLSLPREFSVLRIDQRGIGCNVSEQFQKKDITSLEVARDVLAVIRELKPKRYILHGMSYGTITATLVASLAEQEEGLQPPEAVVLEGTIGRAYEPEEYAIGILQEWQKIKTELPADVQKKLRSQKNPLGIKSRDWAAWLSANLTFGRSYTGPLHAVEELQLLSGSEEDHDILRVRVKAMSKPPAPEKTFVYKSIVCHEFAPDIRDVKYDYDWKNGDLVLTKKRLCEGEAFDRPYEAKEHPIRKSKIYYFVGGRDPVTPESQAKHHISSQSSAARTVIEIKEGGHTSLSTNLMDCSEHLWLAIARGQDEGVRDVLKTCALPSQVTELPPEAP